MAFRSEYAGRCKACGMTFPAGTRLTGTKGNWRHVSCGERRVTPRADTSAFLRPAAPVRATEPDRLAAAVNAETQRVPTAPRVVPSWVASLSAAPDAVASRAAAEAARVARAAEFAARGRVLPLRAPRGPVAEPVRPEDGQARFLGLELDENVPAAPDPADVSGAERFRGLELD